MTEQHNDNYISIEEAANYLGVKTSTIRTWIKNKNTVPEVAVLIRALTRPVVVVVSCVREIMY